MNEDLDLTKILEGCPKGTEFYSSVYGKLKYSSMYVSSSASEISFEVVSSRSIIDDRPVFIHYFRDGKLYPLKGECTVFPSKDQRDWSRFVRFWDNDRPKLKLKFDVNTLQPFDKVLVRDTCNECWICGLFSHKDPFDDRIYPIVCVGTYYKFCIPYNEETKHLLGTRDDCPKYYKWWEEQV